MPDHTAAEAPVDVDAVLRQLKQAKDKELRLRAEKERVRHELEALRTGDLWTREAATQRDLEAIRARRRALLDKETAEREQLHSLDEELREKETSIQQRRRQPLDTLSAIKQAASSIVASASPIVTDNASTVPPSSQSLRIKPSGDKRVPISHLVSSTVPAEEIASIGRPTRSHRYVNNQEAEDAVTKLGFSIDLEKQQSRIKRLEQQLAESKALQQNGNHGWDLPPVTTSRDRLHLSRTDQTAESLSCTNNAERNRTTTASNERTTTPRALPTPSQPQNSPPTTQVSQDSNMVRRLIGSWTPQPQVNTNQSHGDPRFPYPMPNSFVPTAPSIPLSLPIDVLPAPPAMVAAAYSLYSPPAFAPTMAPSIYAPWGYSPPFAQPLFAYSPPVFSQPPSFTHMPPFLPQPSPFSVAPPVDQDVVELQRRLNALQKNDQQSDEDKEFAKVQDLLTGLQHQVTQLTRPPSDDIAVETAEHSDATPRTSMLAETTDPGLKSIKRQHLEAVLRVRNERDLLEEQDKLEEMQERVEKRRAERKRDVDHETWITKQKHELMALRLQRTLAKMDVSQSSRCAVLPDTATRNRPYDSDAGVLLCWDYVSGLLPSVETAQLTFAVYDGTISRSPIKALTSRECESEGPSHKRVIFAANRLVKPLPASRDIVVVVEVTRVNVANAEGKTTVRRLGWGAINLFGQDSASGELQLASGWFKVKLATTSMPNPTKVLVQGSSATDAAESGDFTLHLRIVHGELEEQVQNTVIDPDTYAGRYLAPQTSHRRDQRTALPTPDTAQAPTSLIRPLTSSQPPTRPVPTAEAAGVIVSSTMPDRLTPSIRPSPSPDFLDVERLRLLSSSSRGTRPPSGSVRPRSTLSAIPRNRIGGGTNSLPVLLETVTFDDASSSSPWIRADHTLDRHRHLAPKLFQPDDAFDVYIDGARFLPDNVTVTKVTVAALHADRSKISSFTADSNSKVAISTSDACSPIYNLYVEYREKVFDPTLSLVVRVDTLDVRTKEPVILGYALFPIFLDADTHTQPTRSNGAPFELNSGAFQLPLHSNASLTDATTPLSAVGAVANTPRLPCATLLIRVKSAIMSEDGLQVLSRKMVPPIEWTARGLEEPAPPYHMGEYDSSASAPTPLEMKLYHLRDQEKKRSRTVQQTLQAMGLDGASVSTLLSAKPSTFMDLRHAFRYQPAIGFRLSIDGLHHVRIKTGSFCRVLYSVVPPGAFYQSIRLTSGVQFTTTTDWASLPTSPEFPDGFVSFRDIPADPHMVVIIDVRAVTKNPKTNVYTSQPLAWSFLPVLSDKTESVAAGSFQLPLFTGQVKLDALQSSAGLSALIEEVAAERKKTVLPFMDGASVFVRLEDPQVPTTVALPPLTGATLSSMIPAKAAARYQYDSAKVVLAKKKTPLSKQLPPGVSEKQLDAEINQAFATEMGIQMHRF